MSKKFVNPSIYISPFNVNGLEGRILQIGSQIKKSKNEILIVYGLNSNLEKWWGLVVAFSKFGNVTMADLPGMGGMDSFYEIGKMPNIENMSDYIASIVKLKYRRKKLTIIGIDFGFVLITRMLQKYPEILPRINLVISINGYAHHDDLRLKRISYLKNMLVSSRPYSKIASRYFTSERYLSAKHIVDKDNYFLYRFKIDLDKETDYRTQQYLKYELSNLDNCKKSIDSVFWDLNYGPKTNEIDYHSKEQHLKIIFKNYNHQSTKNNKKPDFILKDEKTAIKILPPKLRQQLKTLSK